MKRPPFQNSSGFTLLELLTVIAIIIVLAGMILAGAGFAQQKAARDRASAEIAALGVALESYKADNGEYPTKENVTDTVNAATLNANPDSVVSLFLYASLSGDTGSATRKATNKRYFEFKPDMLLPAGTGTVTAIVDPFGNPYGYSTINAKTPTSGYNPTYDLWSTAGAPTVRDKWIKNW